MVVYYSAGRAAACLGEVRLPVLFRGRQVQVIGNRTQRSVTPPIVFYG
jgi:hypothetical protein